MHAHIPEAALHTRAGMQVHGADGVPAQIVVSTHHGTRNQPNRARIDLQRSTFDKPSPAYTGPKDIFLNNFVCTATFGPVVPNLVALASLGAGEYTVGRCVTLVFHGCNGHLIVHARSGIVNITGCRSIEAAHVACSSYIILAARTGTIIHLESLKAHIVHATFSIGPQVNLRRLSERYHGGCLRPTIINKLTLYSDKPAATINVFPTGMVVFQCKAALDNLAEVMDSVARLVAPFVTDAYLPTSMLKHQDRGGAPIRRMRPLLASVRSEVLGCLGAALRLEDNNNVDE